MDTLAVQDGKTIEVSETAKADAVCSTAGGFKKIAVVGFGLIGASFAASVKHMWPDVSLLAVDIDQTALIGGLEAGWVTKVCQPDDESFRAYIAQDCDLVVLATPVGVVEGYFHKLADWNYEGIITDTASTKARITQMASQILKYPDRYIPGHPMAGSERNGFNGARADLFKGAHWILCPNETTDADDYAHLHELITGIGARVVSLQREDHDAAVAVVSHVPHFVASSLVQLASRHADEQQSLLRLAAGGFKDSTRIAAGSPELWCGIAFDNKEALVSGLHEMQDIIGQFGSALEQEDRSTLTQLLSSSAEARRSLPAAWIPTTEKLLEVRIPMEDRTGVVAEVTTITSSVGCNIQSIEIDHVTEDSAVLSLVLTDEGDIGKLSSQLIGAGFSVSFSPLSAKEHSHVS